MIELNLEKAYDRMEWNFIMETILFVFPCKLIQIIMNCITSGACRLLWNGEVTKPITPSSDLRKGEPLSSYLFFLCMERLSHWIEARVHSGSWRVIKASRNGPKISHVFFTDDILLFAKAHEDQVEIFKEGLNSFSKKTNQRIDCHKSCVYMSPNISAQVAVKLNDSLGIPLTGHLKKYWGF